MPEVMGSLFVDTLSKWESHHSTKFNKKVDEIENTSKHRSAVNDLKAAARDRQDAVKNKEITRLDFSDNPEHRELIDRLRSHLGKHFEDGYVVEGKEKIQAVFRTLDNMGTEFEQNIPLRMMEVDALTKLNNLIVEMSKDATENHNRLMQHVTQAQKA